MGLGPVPFADEAESKERGKGGQREETEQNAEADRPVAPDEKAELPPGTGLFRARGKAA